MNWLAFSEVPSVTGMGRLIALAVLTIGACLWDLRFRQIPNRLTGPIAAAGLGLALLDGGWVGGGWAFAGLASGAALFLLPVSLGYVGAGDLKMVAAAGTILGPMGTLQGVLLGSVFGGIWAVLWIGVKGWGKANLPYAPPLALGVMVAFSII